MKIIITMLIIAFSLPVLSNVSNPRRWPYKQRTHFSTPRGYDYHTLRKNHIKALKKKKYKPCHTV